MRYKSLPYSVRSTNPDSPDITPPQSPGHSRPRPRPHRLRDIVATLPLILIVPALLLPFVGVNASVGGSLIASPKELAVLPTSGSAWTSLRAVADGTLGTPNLTDQDNKHDVRTLAVALVASRLDSDVYRAKARLAILGAMGTERVGADNSILALGRQLGAYVLAADLIGLSGAEDASFRTWLSAIRTRDLGGHSRYRTLKGTCEDSPHNWGTFACASLVAANRYLGDDAAIQRSWAVFRGLTGERSAYAGFQDMSSDIWACPGVPFTPFNSGCPNDPVRYGAFVKDVTRGSDPPTASGSGLSYTLEILQGVALQAELLARAGHPDAWARLRPAFDWARRNGALDLSSVGYHVTWWANERFGWSLPTRSASMGRVFGFTDWLYGSPAAGTVPVPTTAPLSTPALTPRPTASPTTAATPVPTGTPAAPTSTPVRTAAPTVADVPASTQAPSTPVPTNAPVTPAPTAPPSTILGPGAARARVVDSTAAQEPESTSIVLRTPSGAAPGDLLLAAIEMRGRPTIVTPAGWQRIRLDSNDTIVVLATYARVVTANEPATHRWEMSRSGAIAAVLIAVRDAGADPMGDAAGRISAKIGPIAAPDATSDRSGSLVLGFFGAARATSITPPLGTKEVVETASTGGAYKATLEVAAGASDVGSIRGLIATAGGLSANVSQVLVVRP